jgi:hypothetical protein
MWPLLHSSVFSTWLGIIAPFVTLVLDLIVCLGLGCDMRGLSVQYLNGLSKQPAGTLRTVLFT